MNAHRPPSHLARVLLSRPVDIVGSWFAGLVLAVAVLALWLI